MKRFCIASLVIASCLWLLQSRVQAQADRAFLGKPIKVTLQASDPIVFERQDNIFATNRAYIHKRNPGVLDAPGKWGYDTPGSPSWEKFLSKYDIPLAEGKYELPDGHYMDKKTAREAFRRMLYQHHVKKIELFVNNHFDIYHLHVNPGRILDLIQQHNHVAYDQIMEKENVKKKDSETPQARDEEEDGQRGQRENQSETSQQEKKR